MAASTLSTAAFIYKRLYSDSQISDITLRDHVWYAKVHKEGGFIGDSFVYPIRYGNPQGVSGTFVDARTGVKASKGVQPRAFRTPKYGVITIDNEALQATKGNKGAFMDLVTMETDRILEEVGDSYAFDFYRDTSGNRGRRSAAATNVITLTEVDDARNFKEGMTVIASPNADGSTPRAGSTTVDSVDEDAGTVTLVSAAAITAFANNDYLFRKGDPGTCMEGLAVCTPLVAPVRNSDSWRGIDRGVNPNRLAGSRLDDTSLNAEVALGRLAVKISKIGRTHNVDEAFVNPTHFFNMAQRMNAKVEYDDGGGTANYGFQHLMLHTAAGTMKVYADPDCPMPRGRVSRNGSMYIKHLGGLPHIVDADGNMTLRMSDENSLETRVEGFCNLIQDDPSAQGVCSLASS